MTYSFRSSGFGKSPSTGRIALKQELQREHARQLQSKELQRHQKGYGGSGQRNMVGREDGVVNASLMTSSSLPSELYTVNNGIVVILIIREPIINGIMNSIFHLTWIFK